MPSSCCTWNLNCTNDWIARKYKYSTVFRSILNTFGLLTVNLNLIVAPFFATGTMNSSHILSPDIELLQSPFKPGTDAVSLFESISGSLVNYLKNWSYINNVFVHSGWTRHIRTIHAQHMNFSCDKCPQKFYQKNALEQHYTRIHSKDEPKGETSNTWYM